MKSSSMKLVTTSEKEWRNNYAPSWMRPSAQNKSHEFCVKEHNREKTACVFSARSTLSQYFCPWTGVSFCLCLRSALLPYYFPILLDLHRDFWCTARFEIYFLLETFLKLRMIRKYTSQVTHVRQGCVSNALRPVRCSVFILGFHLMRHRWSVSKMKGKKVWSMTKVIMTLSWDPWRQVHIYFSLFSICLNRWASHQIFPPAAQLLGSMYTPLVQAGLIPRPIGQSIHRNICLADPVLNSFQ